MKNRLLKTFTSLVLTVLMVISVMPAFAITIGAEGGTYKLVTDASTLAVGDKVIIVATGSDVAMSTTQNKNNRGQATVTKTDDTITNISDAVQVFTLVQGTVDGTFAFKTGSGYIYAASSSSNNLKTQTTNNANGSWTISITDSVATIIAQGTNTRKLLQYNSSSSLFSCYATNKPQKDVSIYKLVDANCTHSNKEEVAEVPANCTTPGTKAGVKCTDCGAPVSGCEPIPATGVHTYKNGVCTGCGALDPADPANIVNKAYELKTGATLPGGPYTLTGRITKIDTDYSAQYNNISVIIAVDGADINKPILCFRLKDGTYKGVENLAVNDKITVKGTIKNYNGKIEFDAGCTLEALEVAPATEPVVQSVSLSLNKGVTVNVKINIPEAWLTANAGAKVVFSNSVSLEAKAGENVYSVDLTPAQINDALTVKLTDAEGNTILVAEKDVSVSAYKAKVVAAKESGKLNYTDEKYNALIALIDAALTYSNAADGTIVEELTETFTGVADYEVLHAKEDDKLFAAFSGQLGTDASIYINVNTANVQEGETLILTVGGTEIINGNIADYITKDHRIVITGLFPATFNDTISIDTTIEGSVAEFTFNSYLKAIYNSSSDKNVKNLAVATYRYGLAAEAYLDTLK